MPSLLSEWTMERVTLLAPNNKFAQSGRQLANLHNQSWKLRASDGLSAWGIYQGTAKKPYQIKINLLKLRKGEKSWHCNCRTFKSPCKHVLGLLYQIVDHPEKLSEEDTPKWMQSWLDTATKASKAANRQQGRELSPEQQAQRQAQRDKRQQKITEGLEELEQWLINLIRRGLADPQVRSYDFWDSRAARMVDAQAPGIANWIREMGSIPAKGTDWIEPLLDQLGRLYLLIESFKRIDELSPATQGDIRTMLGWYMKRDELILEKSEQIEDVWLVTGRFMGEMREKLRTQRVWLHGKQTGRDALIMEFVFGDALFETHLQPGWALEGVMMFYPSRYPLRAFIYEKKSDIFADSGIQGMNINDNIAAYAHALSQNPWLPQFPFLLENVIPVHQDNQWLIREIDGTYLPLAPAFQHKWSLLALSGGHPVQVAGEWDGTVFHPTGALDKGRFVDFGLIGKI